MTKQDETAREASIKHLRKMLKPGATVYTILKHVSRSGLSRVIDVVMLGRDERGVHLRGYAAEAIGYPLDPRGGLRVNGAGMDMGWHLVTVLSATLYPDGFTCIGEGRGARRGKGCPSADHHNGDRNYKPHLHRSGGYALRHQWL